MSCFGIRVTFSRPVHLLFCKEFWLLLPDDRSNDHTERIVISDMQINLPIKVLSQMWGLGYRTGPNSHASTHYMIRVSIFPSLTHMPLMARKFRYEQSWVILGIQPAKHQPRLSFTPYQLIIHSSLGPSFKVSCPTQNSMEAVRDNWLLPLLLSSNTSAAPCPVFATDHPVVKAS